MSGRAGSNEAADSSKRICLNTEHIPLLGGQVKLFFGSTCFSKIVLDATGLSRGVSRSQLQRWPLKNLPNAHFSFTPFQSPNDSSLHEGIHYRVTGRIWV